MLDAFAEADHHLDQLAGHRLDHGRFHAMAGYVAHHLHGRAALGGEEVVEVAAELFGRLVDQAHLQAVHRWHIGHHLPYVGVGCSQRLACAFQLLTTERTGESFEVPLHFRAECHGRDRLHHVVSDTQRVRLGHQTFVAQ